jgi:hypothetical protein
MHGRTIRKFPPHLNRRTEGVNEMPEYAPVSTTFLDGQVMVLREMSTVLTSPMYRNGVQQAARSARLAQALNGRFLCFTPISSI